MTHNGQTVASWRTDNPKASLPAKSDLRPDIQGLRAIAVLIVVVYHLWPNRLTGGFVGVDVFFVISGFLITSHLLRRPPLTMSDVLDFWARRVRRLLPAALLVLTVTTVGVRLLAPETQWRSWSLDTIFATLYAVNWRLASSSVDYLQAENAASPVQHFWSLSVEEQFYFVWPLLILLVLLAAYRRRWRTRGAVLAALGVLAAVSLGFSVFATAHEPASAYFMTPTRLWELAAGALLAAALVTGTEISGTQRNSLPLSPPIRALIAWAGLAAMATATLTYTGATAFPGWAALLPVLGTVAVIAANAPNGRVSPGRFLAWHPMQWLGGVSYSFYLWHWPLIVLLPFLSGGHLGLLDKAVIIVSALVLAGLTKKHVEDRFRVARLGSRFLRRRTFQLAAAAMALVLSMSALQIVESNYRHETAEKQLARVLTGTTPCLGAAAMADPKSCPPTLSGPVVPSPAIAAVDKSQAYAHDCWEGAPFAGMKKCVFGDPSGHFSVALVGNSHAGQWLGPIDVIARQKGWKVTTFLASECTATAVDVVWDTAEKRAGCRQWGRNVMAATTSGAFDLVITAERNGLPAVGSTLVESQPRWESGYSTYLKRWLATGVDVVVIHDSPLPGQSVKSVPDCVAAHLNDLAECSGAPGSWIPNDPLIRATRKLHDARASVIDLTKYFCTQTTCPAVIGGVIVYFDGSHITNTYAMTLAPYMLEPLASAAQDATRN